MGGFGEGGAVITEKEQIAEMIRVLRNYGSEKRYHNKVIGTNSRLDELQAGLLRVRLSHMEEITQEREKLAWTIRELFCQRAELEHVRYGISM